MAVDTYGKGKTSIATVAKLAAAMLLGNLGILFTAFAAAVVLKIKAKQSTAPHGLQSWHLRAVGSGRTTRVSIRGRSSY